MKPSAWLPLPLLAISTYALVIHTPPDISHDVAAIAGPIAQTNTTHVSNSTKSALELEYEALELLKQQLFHLHHEVMRKEREILHIINQDFRSCSGVKCYLQTALKKAPDFLELFKTHFRHHSKNSTGSYGCIWSTNSSRSLTDPTSPEGPFDFNEGHDGGPFDFAGGEEAQALDDTKPPFDFDRRPSHGVDSKPFDFGNDDRKHPFGFDHDETDRPHPRPGPGHHPDHHEGRPPHHDDHPTHHEERPPHHEGRPSHHNPYDPNGPNEVSPASHPNGHKRPERPPFHMPHPAPRPRHYKLILATAGLVVSLLILIILFKALRLYCANPRVRAERAARIEECRTKREYRRAACQHRLRQGLSRLIRRPRALSTDDYEEKRAALIRVDEMSGRAGNVEDHIVGADIDSLRRAHELVGHLICAEEVRSFSFAGTQQAQGQQTQPLTHLPPPTQHLDIDVLPSSSRSLPSHRTTTTLPLYVPPPRYSQELEREIHVVDGFRYTPTQSGATPSSSASSFILDDEDDSGTASSVVDCRSRLSTETETATATEMMRKGRSQSCVGEKSFELAGDRYRGRFD